MTHFPILSSVLAVIPLAALAWPLAKVIKPDPVQQMTEEPVIASSIYRADLTIRSAHPFTLLKVTIGEASWNFTPAESEKELYFHLPDSGELPVLASITWPEGTPETAILLELLPDELDTRTHTLWGLGEVTEELIFTWQPE